MQGTVSWEVLAWVVGIIVTAGSGVAIFLFWVWRGVSAIKADWGKDLEARDIKIAAVDARAAQTEEMLRKEINDYRQHAGETFATKSGVSTAIDRLEGSVTRMAHQVEQAVDRLSGRIDRLFEGRQRPPE